MDDIGTVSTSVEDHPSEIPRLLMELADAPDGLTAKEVLLALQCGEPSIHADPAHLAENIIVFNGAGLDAGDPPRIAARLKEILVRT